MKIAAAVNEKSLDAVIPGTLDEAKGILILETEPSLEIVDHVTSDYANVMWDEFCEAILCGPVHDAELFESIADKGITRYLAAGMTVKAAVKAMEDYDLPYIKDYVGGTGHKH